jgi:3-hydroxybutyryl-CoA dehydratase
MQEYIFDELLVGETGTFKQVVSAEMLSIFSSLSGDNNPLHCDEVYAKSLGHPSCVVHGMLTSSLYSRLVGVYLPGKYALLQSIDIKFLSPVFVDDILTVIGEVTYRQNAYKVIEIKAKIENQHKKCISKAKISVQVTDKDVN